MGSPFNQSMKNNIINIIIETPKGSRNKYAYEQEQNIFKLKKVLPEGMVFPYNFGFIPQTLSGDGDPADVLVLMDEPVFTGCHLEGRLIGIIRADQKKKNKTVSNPRLLAVCSESQTYKDIKSIEDLNPDFLDEVEHFFKSYLEVSGKKFIKKGISGPGKAMKILKSFQDAYRQSV